VDNRQYVDNYTVLPADPVALVDQHQVAIIRFQAPQPIEILLDPTIPEFIVWLLVVCVLDLDHCPQRIGDRLRSCPRSSG
jgi:hypothetical protein